MDTLEIDSLKAGPELDALVAEKIMGWKSYIRNGVCYTDHGVENAPDCWWEFYPSCLYRDVEDVIDKIKEGRDLFIEWWNDGEWFVAAHNLLGDRGPTGRSDEFDTDTGEPSLPLAVCRYAVKLLAEEEEGWKRYHPEEK